MRYYILQDPDTKAYITTRWGSMAEKCKQRGAMPIVVLSGWNIVPTFTGTKISAKEFCRIIDEKNSPPALPEIREVFQRRVGKIIAIVTNKEGQTKSILDTEMYLNDEVNQKAYKKFGVGIRVHF